MSGDEGLTIYFLNLKSQAFLGHITEGNAVVLLFFPLDAVSLSVFKYTLLLLFTQLCPTICDPMDCSTQGFPVFHHLPELVQTHVHWVGDAIQPSHLPSPSSPAFHLSRTRVFSKESVLWIRWPKYWSFGFSISPSNEYSGLISFRIDWFDSPVVQGTLKNFLKHHNSKASILQCSASFMVQLWHPCRTTYWKNHSFD